MNIYFSPTIWAQSLSSVLILSCSFTPNFPHTLQKTKIVFILLLKALCVTTKKGSNLWPLPSTATFSSVPSLQSWSPSHLHSCSRHSLLWGQRSLVVQTSALVQLSSSERSQQSGWPSQRIMADTHWPLVHLNSVLQSLSTIERDAGAKITKVSYTSRAD